MSRKKLADGHHTFHCNDCEAFECKVETTLVRPRLCLSGEIAHPIWLKPGESKPSPVEETAVEIMPEPAELVDAPDETGEEIAPEVERRDDANGY